jgi:hypothetical protein
MSANMPVGHRVSVGGSKVTLAKLHFQGLGKKVIFLIKAQYRTDLFS